MVKILLISTVGLKYDGITNVMLSNLEAMDKSNLEFFVAETLVSENNIREKFKALGCKLVKFPNRKKNPLKYFWSVFSFIRKNKIDVVHANGNSATLAIEMLAAKLGNCPIRIAHSHNTKADFAKLDKILRPVFDISYNKAVACSNEAGKWLFKDKSFLVVNNGRDIDKYSFNPIKRQQMRDKLNGSDKLFIGHVGGFVTQKNHDFLLHVYKEISLLRNDAIFFVIGDGDLKKQIYDLTDELGIKDKVVFTGNIDNVQDYLQAMDVMIMPSLFEGLPLAVIEWQLSGLPVVMSDVITKDCIISDKVERLSLKESYKSWAIKVIEASNCDGREARVLQTRRNAKEMGFDIKDSAKKLRNLYLANNH